VLEELGAFERLVVDPLLIADSLPLMIKGFTLVTTEIERGKPGRTYNPDS